MKQEKPIPSIITEEDERISPRPNNQNDLGIQKQTHNFWLNLAKLFLEAIVKYAGLILVAALFVLFYWVLNKENFTNEGHISQLFELIKTASLLILGYMFGERRQKF